MVEPHDFYDLVWNRLAEVATQKLASMQFGPYTAVFLIANWNSENYHRVLVEIDDKTYAVRFYYKEVRFEWDTEPMPEADFVKMRLYS